MPKQATVDHGVILHYAGAHQLFPVAKKDQRSEVRLARHDDVAADEVRVGWDGFFRPFLDRGLVFVFDETEGKPMPAAQAAGALGA